jgi:hypothetical protein
MGKQGLVTLLFILFFHCIGYPQTIDTSSPATTVLPISLSEPDSIALLKYQPLATGKSALLDQNKRVLFDVQQSKFLRKNIFGFFLLMAMLGVLTYIKIVFGKQVEELFQSFINSNIAQQIFRTQSNEISFSSFLLHTNFIVALSLYLQFVLINYFHVTALKSFFSIAELIFLFTFFYLTKLLAVKFTGLVFEVKEESNAYAFDFSSQCKIVGLTLIPALFVLYVAPEKFFNVILDFTILIALIISAIFIWRGLSTGMKFMYRSAYHFFIYVCVVEISPIFLLFKLLTKTIT